MKTYKEFLEAKKLSIEFDFSDSKKKAQMQKVIDFFKKNYPKFKLTSKGNILKVDGGGKSLDKIGKDIYNNYYVKKVMHEDKTLKDIVKREKESMYSGSNTSKSIRTMTKDIKREKSDDVIIVHLSDDGDSVMRMEKDDPKLKSLLKKGWEYIK